MPVICKYCENEYSTRSSLNRHVREKHLIFEDNCEYEKYFFNCLETNCNDYFKFNKELVEHLKNYHNIDPQEERISFENYKEFNLWLNKLKDCGSKYIKKTVQINGKTKHKTMYFSCHRSGKYTPKKDNRQRILKVNGSCKINTGCTSNIKLIQYTSGKCEINYIKLHYGHSVDLKYVQPKKIKRLDKGIHATNKHIRDKVKDRLIKNVKGKSSSNMQDINRRHQTAEKSIFFFTYTDEGWKVESGNEVYYVTQNSNNKCCNIVCTECDICIHTYNCTCIDFIVKSTICKHIHNFVLSNKSQESDIEPVYNSIEIQEENELHLATLSGDKQNINNDENSLEMIRGKIKLQFAKFKEQVNKNKDIGMLSNVLKTLKNLTTLLEVSNRDQQDLVYL